jgi:hypothetical protein
VIDSQEQTELQMELAMLTGHSFRVTFLDAATHAGFGPNETMLQANWSSSAMPLKYTRDRRTIPMNMIKDVARSMRQGWCPGQLVESADQFRGDGFVKENAKLLPATTIDTEDFDPLIYYLLPSALDEKNQNTYKYHVASKIEPWRLACTAQRQIAECLAVGTEVEADPTL